MTFNDGVLLITFPIMVVLIVVQATFFAYSNILGTTLQIVPIFLFAWAIWRGSAETIIVAFVAGFLIDLLSSTPMGANAIALMLGTLVIAPIRDTLPTSRFLLPAIMASLAMLTFLLANTLLLRLTGYPINLQSVGNIPQIVILHAIVTLPVYWLLRGSRRLWQRQPKIEL